MGNEHVLCCCAPHRQVQHTLCTFTPSRAVPDRELQAVQPVTRCHLKLHTAVLTAHSNFVFSSCPAVAPQSTSDTVAFSLALVT